jgi:hypothetical protein
MSDYDREKEIAALEKALGRPLGEGERALLRGQKCVFQTAEELLEDDKESWSKPSLVEQIEMLHRHKDLSDDHGIVMLAVRYIREREKQELTAEKNRQHRELSAAIETLRGYYFADVDARRCQQVLLAQLRRDRRGLFAHLAPRGHGTRRRSLLGDLVVYLADVRGLATRSTSGLLFWKPTQAVLISLHHRENT